MTHIHEDKIRAIIIDMRAAGKSWAKVAVALNDAGTKSQFGYVWTGRTSNAHAMRRGLATPRARVKRLRGEHVAAARAAGASTPRPRKVAECEDCGKARSVSALGRCNPCYVKERERIAGTSQRLIQRLVGHHGCNSAAWCIGVSVDEVTAWVLGEPMDDATMVAVKDAVARFDDDEERRNPWRPVPIYDERDRMIPRQAVA